MARILSVTLVLFLTAVSVSVSAQTNATREAAERYVAMPQIQQMISSMFAPDSMAKQFSAGLPPQMKLAEEQSAAVGQLLSGIMQDLRPRMETAMVDAAAKYFTLEEIEALIAFYESEIGASVMTKMQPFFQDYMAVVAPEMMRRTQDALPKILEIMKKP